MSCSCSDLPAERALRPQTLLTDAAILVQLVVMYAGDYLCVECVSEARWKRYHHITITTICAHAGIEDGLACDACRCSWLSADNNSSIAARSPWRTSHCPRSLPLAAICAKPSRLWTRWDHAAEPSKGTSKIVAQDLLALLPALLSWPMMASLSCFPAPPASLLLRRRLPTRLFCRRRG